MMRLLLLLVVCGCALAAAAPKTDTGHKGRIVEKVMPHLMCCDSLNNVRICTALPSVTYL